MEFLVGFYSILKDREPFIFSLIRALEDTGLDYNPEKLEGSLPDGMFYALKSVLPENYPREKITKIADEAEEVVLETGFEFREYLEMILDKGDFRKIMISHERSGFTNKVLSESGQRRKFDLIITRDTRTERISSLFERSDVEEGVVVTVSDSILEEANRLGHTTISLKGDSRADYTASDFLDVSTILEEL